MVNESNDNILEEGGKTVGNKVNNTSSNNEQSSFIIPSDINFDNEIIEAFNVNLKDPSRVVSNTLRGFNLLDKPGPLPASTNTNGLVFFTRPQLNLSKVNIRNVRQMYKLLTNDKWSIMAYVRATLDPRLNAGLLGPEYNSEVLRTPLVDPYMPFIPLLTNTLETLSGWPDMVVPDKTTNPGIRKEQISLIDGTFEIYDVFDLDATFTNFANEPITLLFQTWIMYASLVFEGMLYPYIDYIIENEFDYNTRIYRLVLDSSKKYVTKIAATGASFPINVPTGAMFNYNADSPLLQTDKSINIRFKCMGAMYNDDILLLEFNKTMAIFNPDVRKLIKGGSSNLDKIPSELLEHFSYAAYPLINLRTYELEWYVSKDNPTYQKLVNGSSITVPDNYASVESDRVIPTPPPIG